VEEVLAFTGAPGLRELQLSLSQAFAGGPQLCLAWLNDCPPISSSRRVAIYSDGIASRFESTLVEDFPRIRALLGEARFGQLVRGYLEDYPSISPNLSDLGYGLSQFLRDFPDDKFSFLSDIARVEWAECRGVWTQDFAPLSAESLMGLSTGVPETIFLIPHPSLESFSLDWPVESVWEEDPNEMPSHVNAWMPSLHTVRVHRKGFHTIVKRMDDPEMGMVNALLSGSALSQIIEAGMTLAPEGLGNLLQEWVREAVIVDIKIRK